MPFELNCSYYFWVSYKENIESYFRLKIAEKPLFKLYKLMTICRGNLIHAEELRKKLFNKYAKPKPMP